MRVHPDTTGASVLCKNKIKVGVIKWTRFVALGAALPIGYLWIPLTCCFKNPVVKYAFDEYNYNYNNTNDEDYKNDEGCPVRFGHNMAGMFMGAISCFTCFYGCAKCCTADPREVFS